MTAPGRHNPGESATDVAIDKDGGGRLAAVVSAVALLSPYQNSNFEVFAVPITIVNDGGRTGTVLSMELQATNLETKETKRFNSSDFGRWTMEKTRANAYETFAPI